MTVYGTGGEQSACRQQGQAMWPRWTVWPLHPWVGCCLSPPGPSSPSISRLLKKLSPGWGLLWVLPASEQHRSFQPSQGLFLISGHVLGVRDVKGGPHLGKRDQSWGGGRQGQGWVQAASSSSPSSSGGLEAIGSLPPPSVQGTRPSHSTSSPLQPKQNAHRATSFFLSLEHAHVRARTQTQHTHPSECTPHIPKLTPGLSPFTTGPGCSHLKPVLTLSDCRRFQQTIPSEGC